MAGVDVVIAEDSRIQAKILQKRLTDAGHAVRWAENGSDALVLVRERRPDIVISDIEMPVMTGYEFCKAVKSDPGLKTIPFIMMSTLSDPIDIIRGLDAGADNYVTKPYDPDYLLGRMQSLLAIRRSSATTTEAAMLEVDACRAEVPRARGSAAGAEPACLDLRECRRQEPGIDRHQPGSLRHPRQPPAEQRRTDRISTRSISQIAMPRWSATSRRPPRCSVRCSPRPT
jgi:DNA-binding response OmpR family regulator